MLAILRVTASPRSWTDGRGRGEANFWRILGSLPVDDLGGGSCRLPSCAAILDLVRAEWRQDELKYHGA